MKKIFKHALLYLVTLFLVSKYIQGMNFEKGFQTLFIASLALTGAEYVIKPIINLLLLPINLITFNLFKWISNAVTLYLVTLVVRGFEISGFYYQGFSSAWFDIPKISLTGIFSYVLYSILISIITSLFFWLLRS